jgi:transcriptional regulator with XRE-family HTH domain
MRRPIDEVLAERVRTFRTEQKLRQEDVAERTRQLGHPVSRLALVKIEAGGTRAASASLADVLVLAAALNVPPVLLFVPLGVDEAVELAPGLIVHPHRALDWVAGDDEGLQDVVPWGSREAWFENSQPIRLFRGLRERQEAAHRAQASEDEAAFDRALVALASWIEAMEAVRMSIPELPEAWQARMAQLAVEG